MKKLILLTAVLLGAAPAFGQGGEKLPPAKRISAEKLILTEKYRTSLEKCRELSRKKAKESCLEQKKNDFNLVIADLERDPQAYFAAQERNALDEKALEEKNKPKPRQ